MNTATKGVLAVIFACTIWGLSPLYYNMLVPIPPAEVLSHRTLWSVVIFIAIVGYGARRAVLVQTVKSPRLMLYLCVASLMIAINWYLFIQSVGIARVLESSFGYYIFPFFMVVMGRLIFNERLSVLQSTAVMLAFCGVMILVLGLNQMPWIALLLAITFSSYGVIKRIVAIDPIVSVTVEVLLLLPFAVLYLAFYGHWAEPFQMVLLVFSGAITAGPLILLSYAAQHIRMASVGILQYINPSLQFLCAVVFLGEIFTLWHGFAFGCIWAALVLYSASTLLKDRKTSAT